MTDIRAVPLLEQAIDAMNAMPEEARLKALRLLKFDQPAIGEIIAAVNLPAGTIVNSVALAVDLDREFRKYDIRRSWGQMRSWDERVADLAPLERQAATFLKMLGGLSADTLDAFGAPNLLTCLTNDLHTFSDRAAELRKSHGRSVDLWAGTKDFDVKFIGGVLPDVFERNFRSAAGAPLPYGKPGKVGNAGHRFVRACLAKLSPGAGERVLSFNTIRSHRQRFLVGGAVVPNP